MMLTPSKRQVAVIGAGRRVRQNFLPALEVLDGWSVAGLTSRGGHSAAEAGRQWGLDPVPSISSFDWRNIDTVVVSVTTTEVPKVLYQLEPYAGGLDLVLDTPPFARARDVRWATILRRFRRVVVAEDFMRFPDFELMRRAVRGGAIGTPREVVLVRTGFRYHGTALARSLFGFPPVLTAISRPGRDGREAHYRLRGGGRVRVTGAYEPARGVVTVHGTEGSISSGANGGQTEGRPRQPVFVVEPIEQGSAWLGAAVDTRAGRFEYRPEALPALQHLDLERPDRFNLAKTTGTVDVLRQLDQPEPGYGPPDAIYDAFLATLANVLPAWADPGGRLALGAMRALGRQGAPSR